MNNYWMTKTDVEIPCNKCDEWRPLGMKCTHTLWWTNGDVDLLASFLADASFEELDALVPLLDESELYFERDARIAKMRDKIERTLADWLKQFLHPVDSDVRMHADATLDEHEWKQHAA